MKLCRECSTEAYPGETQGAPAPALCEVAECDCRYCHETEHAVEVTLW